MRTLITDVAEIPAYRASDGSEKSIRFLVDPEETPLHKLHAGMTVIPPGYANAKIAADHEEIFFILSGQADVLVGEEHQVVGPYTVIVVPPGVPRQIRALGVRLTYLWVSSDPPSEVWQKRQWEMVDVPIPGRD